MTVKIADLLVTAQEMSASDLHINVNRPPIVRIDGKLKKLDNYPDIEQKDLQEILEVVTNQEQLKRFLEQKELDFSYEDEQIGRCRVNSCIQKGVISLAFRLLMRVLSPLSSLGLPDIYGELSLRPRGFILVTGPTGSGKSTSMAAMISHINNNQERHILTIEDPIEYIHKDNKSVIIQRNVGEDTDSFANALKHALRHDPDVIVVGEMRDLTTMATAISAAETGHLVLGTLHTIDAAETIDRIVDVFPPEHHGQIRLQLSQVLLAVLSQTLIPRLGGGRAVACEVMVGTPAIRHTIRDGQIHQLQNNIQMGRKDGMQTLNQSISALVEADVVSWEDAMQHSNNTAELMNLAKHREPAVLSKP
ncbi:MAG TPA: PilT/PilU family type 4a pilus ATPase [Dehalococcoidia bacterium]|nr:PilT/PilU family type 4a pilus ATPase [Dehalococcoidia bacterium]